MSFVHWRRLPRELQEAVLDYLDPCTVAWLAWTAKAERALVRSRPRGIREAVTRVGFDRIIEWHASAEHACPQDVIDDSFWARFGPKTKRYSLSLGAFDEVRVTSAAPHRRMKCFDGMMPMQSIHVVPSLEAGSVWEVHVEALRSGDHKMLHWSASHADGQNFANWSWGATHWSLCITVADDATLRSALDLAAWMARACPSRMSLGSRGVVSIQVGKRSFPKAKVDNTLRMMWGTTPK